MKRSLSPRAPGRPGLLVLGVLPSVAFPLAVAAGYLNWQDSSQRSAQSAAVESVAAARKTTEVILSYRAETAEEELNAARDRLTGGFLEEYTKLVNEVVIPGAREKDISAVAEVPAAASVSATADRAVALLFVNQAVSFGDEAPTATASCPMARCRNPRMLPAM
jgi:Mce-associated membrane protein